ncbi:hypothetical protein U1Q18_001540 [Sarracenia purpurea var. burkii]
MAAPISDILISGLRTRETVLELLQTPSPYNESQSVELTFGKPTIGRLQRDDTVTAALSRVWDGIQWSLAKDEVAIKLDESHYSFIPRLPPGAMSDDEGVGEGRDPMSINGSDDGVRVGRFVDLSLSATDPRSTSDLRSELSAAH